MIRRLGRIFVTVISTFVAIVLPVTTFFLTQFLLLNRNRSPQVHGPVLILIFAIAVWFFLVLPRLGWKLVRHRLSGRVALHRAAWALLTYVAMFGTLSWLMGA